MQITNDWSQTAKSVFGFEKLRPFQRQVLEAVDAGIDCLAVSPTGSGKTACFALPAAREMTKPEEIRGIILVVSPLIALMHDQGQKLKKIGILPSIFDRLQSSDDRIGQWDAIASGQSPIVFVSPERLALRSFREQLAALRPVTLAVIDEAHCTSQWGFSLRPEYRQIGEFLDESFRDASRIALTATASAGARHDIVCHLGLRNPKVILNDFKRTNIQFSVKQPRQWNECQSAVIATIEERYGDGKGKTVVYAQTRKSTIALYSALSRRGIKATVYHAGMDGQSRNKNQNLFIEGNSSCMVATSAFGLGIDLPEIRHVIHAGMPQNLEQYLQEAGRAGRDGRASSAIMIFHPRDFHTHRYMIEMQYPKPSAVKLILNKFFPSGRDPRLNAQGNHRSCFEKHTLLAGLASNSRPGEKKELSSALDFLVRENLLSEMSSPTPWDPNYLETVVAVNESSDPSRYFSELFWRRLQFRRDEAMTKLETMRLYATTAIRSQSAAQDILRAYFEDSVDDHPPAN